MNATSAGGEVDALDPAGYGPITISQAITIEGQGWSYIAPPASGNGITINAVSGNVSIHGVSLNGAGITGGTNGIVFNSGDSLTVTDCVAQNFVNNGSQHGPRHPDAADLRHGQLRHYKHHRFKQRLYWHLLFSAERLISHRERGHRPCRGHQQCIWDCDRYFNSASGSATLAISNSTASNQVVSNTAGFFIKNASAPLAVSIDNCNISGNYNGITTLGSPKVLLGRSVITNNSNNSISNASCTFFTYQNNQINLNGNSNTVGGTALVALTFQ